MYKNQLQELAQRSCFNLPAYGWKREGPDHAPRFKASVNFNGEIFESPFYCPTLRQAQHAAAEVALNLLSSRGSKSLTARVLDETGVYKNLLQETAHKAGLNLPLYTTVRSGPGHVPVFTCTVELAGLSFTGDSAKTKKQAEKNAAIAAWSALKNVPKLVGGSHKEERNHNDYDDQEQEQVIVARVLSNFRAKTVGKVHNKDYQNHPRRSSNGLVRAWRSEFPIKQKNSFIDLLPPPPPRTTSMILPLAKNREGQDGNFRHDPDNKEQGQTQFREGSMCFLGPKLTSLKRVPAIACNLRCTHMGILGNYSINPRGIGVAQAVQIRSVIPVCSAPPFPSSLPTKLASTHLSYELSKLQVKDE